MVRALKLLALVLILCLSYQASAEIYQGIKPYSTLGEIKAKFPNATFSKITLASANKYDVTYSVTGTGIKGEIFIRFHDLRSFWKEQSDKAWFGATKEMYSRLAQLSGDSMGVTWVRWVPDKPFPVERLIEEHGNPDKSGFADEDDSPFKKWTSKGIYARLSEDSKEVFEIDFTFTEKELLTDQKERFGVSTDTLGKKSKK
ncbi:MAG: hypothetical protein ACLPN1_07595 [Dissulfurispiraceae bacterium]|jgi:hypothetical protein